jgi:hypothetical protein
MIHPPYIIEIDLTADLAALDANPTPSTRLYHAEIAAGVDPVEAIRRKIERDFADDLKQQEAAVRALLRKTARKPRQPPPDGLKTAALAAAKLNCSIKTLNAHVAAGDLRYVIIGKGTKRPRKMFADTDLNAFIANQTRTGSPACRSIASRVRRSGTSNFESEVIAFTGQPRPRPGAKPKK